MCVVSWCCCSEMIELVVCFSFARFARFEMVRWLVLNYVL